MNILKLREYVLTSNTIKNYKALCAILDLKVTNGGSKRSQLKEIERYFKYHKEGNKFIIDEIYTDVLPKIDHRKENSGGANNVVDYIKHIENLILDLLIQGGINSTNGFGKVFLSKNQLLKEFNMINDNYVFCKRRIPKLSKFMNIDQETVEEWYDINDGMLERNLMQALKSLENQSLILWSREITIAEAIPTAEVTKDGKEVIKRKYIDVDGEEQTDYKYRTNDEISLHYREGTETEKEFILQTERDILLELHCESKQKVIQFGMWDLFKTKIDNIILKELNLAFYYKSFKIIFNKKHIKDALNNIYEIFELTEEDKQDGKFILNAEIVNRTIENASKRHDRAVEDKSKIIGRIKDDEKGQKIKRRSTNNYINDNIELSHTLILKSSGNIKEKVKKTKLDKIEDDISIDDFINNLE